MATAPHFIKDKESSCGCAGVFNATYSMSILAQIFDNVNAINKLENFTSINGAQHYGCRINEDKIKLSKSKNNISFIKSLKLKEQEISIFEPDFPVFWEVKF